MKPYPSKTHQIKHSESLNLDYHIDPIPILPRTYTYIE